LWIERDHLTPRRGEITRGDGIWLRIVARIDYDRLIEDEN